METRALDSQSLFDISVQECGTAEGVFGLAVENGLSITDALEAGQEIECTDVLQREIHDYYRARNLKPATDIQENSEEGIEFWKIERDFIVN
jgi:hypothetical protein